MSREARRPSFQYFKRKGFEIQIDEKKERLRGGLLSQPVASIDLERAKTISELVEAWSKTSIQSRNIALCAQVYKRMLTDSDRPTIFLGLSGALIAGGLRKVIRDMIEYGVVDVVVSTGAIVYQDFYQGLGYKHYMGSADADDSLLRDLYIDRIYDTYVDEVGFVKADDIISDIASRLEARRYSSREFLAILGSRLKDENSILYSAWKHGLPVFCPAIADSSIGIALAGAYRWAKEASKALMSIDSTRDNFEIAQIVLKSKKTAAIYVGGGVPKNYINDAAVMLDYTPGHVYAIQLTVDAPHWGGLTGSTLEEARSWGKLAKEVRRATAYVEATIGLPLVMGYVMQKELWRGRRRLVFRWREDQLSGIEPGGRL